MKKNKEHKKGESTIGKIIYGFLLFMPLFAIGVTCGYAMFNKNAYESYEGFNKETTSTLATEINSGLNYSFTFNNTIQNNTGSGIIEISNLTFATTDTNNNQNYINNKNNIKYIEFKGVGFYNPSRMYFYNDEMTTLFYIVTNTQATGTFIAENNTSLLNNNYIYLVNEQETGNFISNVFYYSVDKVTESPLFSWATNSVIYSTMNATCTQLSITAPFIPLLLSYWLIISVIYFLYDIALMLIWLLHDKIHEMRDSLA